ncbi:MAG: hypothetical protein ABIQ27_02490 [Flavobacterium sp.]|uniref:hypothetical protein n=1 Tax=Flavobacterium sp. TaxID=239 RepID=UPI0032671C24
MKLINDFETFQARIKAINIEIENAFVDQENEVGPIYDGALDSAKYFDNTRLKILWLMKEPYDDEREGYWSLPELFTTKYDTFFSDLIKGTSGRTWQPVVYISYGILNEFKNWDEIPFISNDPSIVKSLEKVAWVNIQKLPSETGKSTNMKNIYSAYNNHKQLIQNQIEILNPDVIICGNTFKVLKDYFGAPKEVTYDMIEYYEIGKRLVINAYHPAQLQITRERYVNNIVECVKNWSRRNERLNKNIS